VFDALAGLLCSNELQIGVGYTQYGRGLVSKEDVPADEVLLSVDAFSTLLVVDEPLRTGVAFGGAVLSDWQSVWGVELPTLLASYLQSSELQQQQQSRHESSDAVLAVVSVHITVMSLRFGHSHCQHVLSHFCNTERCISEVVVNVVLHGVVCACRQG
jgi:hypothetical protein